MNDALLVIATGFEVGALLGRLGLDGGDRDGGVTGGGVTGGGVTGGRGSGGARPGGAGWPILEVGESQWLVITGIGKVNAAGGTAWALAHLPAVRNVINIGVAGSLCGDELEIGDLIVANESVFAEEGIDLPAGWADVGALGFALVREGWAIGNRIRCSQRLIDDLCEVLPAGVRRGVIATVDTCSGTDEAAEVIRRRTGADAEAMEGAGVVLTARRLGRAAAEVRVISNSCGEREKQRWDIKSALVVVDEVLQCILEKRINR